MKSPCHASQPCRRRGRAPAWSILAATAVAASALAAPPLVPLPPPEFSFDAASPTVTNGWVEPRDVLVPGNPYPPEILIPGAALGLFSTLDEIDSLSGPTTELGGTSTFVLLFSVDRASVGTAPPDPGLVDDGIPYNMQDQASRGQAASDLFMSLDAFTRAGKVRPAARGGGNNTETRNNYDEGGTDYSALPPTHSRDNPGTVPQDNVDATAQLQTTTTRGGRPINVYFTVTPASPSLSSLSDGFPLSGSNVFFNPDPLREFPPPPSTTIYALAADLGLMPSDDIDGMVVYDADTDGVFSDTDFVLFSLTPYSPSLSYLGEPADVFIVRYVQPPLFPEPALFAAGWDLGLGAAADNIDALDVLICSDVSYCAHQHGIRGIRFDWNDDGYVSLVDFERWPFCMTGPDLGPPPTSCVWFDRDEDDDIDLVDFVGFQVAFTGTP